MKLGYVTNGLQNHRLDDALRLLADHGYQAVAITPDTMHLDPFRTASHHVETIGGLLQRLGLKPVMETGSRFLLDRGRKHWPTLCTRDEIERGRRLAFYDRVAQIGIDLGADVLSFWSGAHEPTEPDASEASPPVEAERVATRDAWLLDGIAEASEFIAARGLIPALEPEPGMAIATIADWHDWKSRGAERLSRLRMVLDVGHVYADCTGEDPNEPLAAIREAAVHAVQVHLEDAPFGRHEHLPPGDGDVDFPGVFEALRASSYEGPVCFELSRDSHRAPRWVARCAEVFRDSL